MKLRHGGRELALERCLVMGIVNRTPDSFYDGGRMLLDEATKYAIGLVEAGADILDLGAVKAGPGEPVSEQEEMDRLLPLVEAVRVESDVAISVETGRPDVARAAFRSGASILNDVTGLDEEDLLGVCVEHDAAIVLMHAGGQIRGRPRHPRYADVVADVISDWRSMTERAIAAGLSREHLIVDPGLDFGKNTYHSLELMRRLDELVAFGLPVLVAPSRKDIVGESLDLPVEERLEGTLALVALSVLYGTAIVRVHDVKESVRVVRMVESVMGVRSPEAPIRGLWD